MGSIKVMKQFGYKNADEDGMCYGIAFRAIASHNRDEFRQFKTRMYLLEGLTPQGIKSLHNFYQTKEVARKKQQNIDPPRGSQGPASPRPNIQALKLYQPEDLAFFNNLSWLKEENPQGVPEPIPADIKAKNAIIKKVQNAFSNPNNSSRTLFELHLIHELNHPENAQKKGEFFKKNKALFTALDITQQATLAPEEQTTYDEKIAALSERVLTLPGFFDEISVYMGDSALGKEKKALSVGQNWKHANQLLEQQKDRLYAITEQHRNLSLAELKKDIQHKIDQGCRSVTLYIPGHIATLILNPEQKKMSFVDHDFIYTQLSTDSNEDFLDLVYRILMPHSSADGAVQSSNNSIITQGFSNFEGYIKAQQQTTEGLSKIKLALINDDVKSFESACQSMGLGMDMMFKSSCLSPSKENQKKLKQLLSNAWDCQAYHIVERLRSHGVKFKFHKKLSIIIYERHIERGIYQQLRNICLGLVTLSALSGGAVHMLMLLSMQTTVIYFQAIQVVLILLISLSWVGAIFCATNLIGRTIVNPHRTDAATDNQMPLPPKISPLPKQRLRNSKNKRLLH